MKMFEIVINLYSARFICLKNYSSIPPCETKLIQAPESAIDLTVESFGRLNNFRDKFRYSKDF